MRDVVQFQWDNYENVSESMAEEASKFGILPPQIPDLLRWEFVRTLGNNRRHFEAE
jgi:hypothetical protein